MSEEMPDARRKEDLGVLTAAKIMGIVIGAVTPFLLVLLFVARLLIQTALDSQDRANREFFISRREFDAYRSELQVQFSRMEANQLALLAEIRKAPRSK